MRRAGLRDGTSALGRLHEAHRSYGEGLSARKRRWIRELDRAVLATPARVRRLHEILCFLRAYPDDPSLLADIERALWRFSRRADVRAHREALADSGIAGTALRYRFFWPTAKRLAARWPSRLALDREMDEDTLGRLRAALPVLAPTLVAEAIRRTQEDTWRVVDRLRGRQRDGAWFVGRVAAWRGSEAMREALHDGVDADYVLEPGPDTPSRTTASFRGVPVVFWSEAPSRARPDLARELARPPRSVRAARGAEGRALLALAQDAMLTRSRDLDAFAWGNAADVTLVSDDDGLGFAVIGVVPPRRLALPVVHGWLTLRSGVPVGYVQTDTLLGAAEVAFNTFETFRGADASHVFGRLLATARHVLGARAFSIEPYQLGHGNDEGIASGAWWFYEKLGFRPRDKDVRRAHAEERGRMRRQPSHRSDAAMLERLARAHLYWEPDRRVRSWLPRVPLLGFRLGSPDPDAAAARLGMRGTRTWSRAERHALEMLAPVVLALEGIEAWSATDRRRLAEVVRAKAGPAELAFERRLRAHGPAARALLRLLRRP